MSLTRDHDPTRRRLLRRSLALATTAAFAGLPGCTLATSRASDPHPALGRTLRRIGIGSCAEQHTPQPVWDPIQERHFDLFVFLGDNIHADTRDPTALRAEYASLAVRG